MLRGAITAVSALALTIVPVAAQAAPQPISRAPAATEEGESLTTTGWVLVGIGAALLIWGIIELTDDDEPTSP
jgi:protein-S-isoprenylcysteine O-methyltransferase Ste14